MWCSLSKSTKPVGDKATKLGSGVKDTLETDAGHQEPSELELSGKAAERYLQLSPRVHCLPFLLQRPAFPGNTDTVTT